MEPEEETKIKSKRIATDVCKALGISSNVLAKKLKHFQNFSFRGSHRPFFKNMDVKPVRAQV